MTVLPIYEFPHIVLRQKAKKVRKIAETARRELARVKAGQAKDSEVKDVAAETGDVNNLVWSERAFVVTGAVCDLIVFGLLVSAGVALREIPVPAPPIG